MLLGLHRDQRRLLLQARAPVRAARGEDGLVRVHHDAVGELEVDVAVRGRVDQRAQVGGERGVLRLGLLLGLCVGREEACEDTSDAELKSLGCA